MTTIIRGNKMRRKMLDTLVLYISKGTLIRKMDNWLEKSNSQIDSPKR